MFVARVEQFMIDTCKDRPPSHGVDHMRKVRDNALWILQNMEDANKPSALHVSTVALLHDVADHKYDPDKQLAAHMREFVSRTGLETDQVMACIEAISYSKEKQKGMRWFQSGDGETTPLLNDYWVRVRDIVSDADKLEALGFIGGERCLQYAEEKGHHGKDGVLHLLQHMQDKLLLLRDNFLVTKPGKAMARSRHDELVWFVLGKCQKYLHSENE